MPRSVPRPPARSRARALPRPRRLGLVLALGGVVLLGVAPGCSRSLDTADAAQKIKAKLEELTPTVAPIEVSCPDEVQAAEGVEFTCRVTTKDGTATQMTFVQTDDAGTLDSKK